VQTYVKKKQDFQRSVFQGAPRSSFSRFKIALR